MDGFAQLGSMVSSGIGDGIGDAAFAVSKIGAGESGGVPTGGRPGGLSTALRFGGYLGQGIAGYQSSQAQASLARQNASASRATAAIEAQRYKGSARRRLGASRARAGASGTQFSGSVLDVLADQAAEEEMNRQMILYGGEVQASRSNAQSAQLKNQGRTTLLSGVTTGVADAMPRLLE